MQALAAGAKYQRLDSKHYIMTFSPGPKNYWTLKKKDGSEHTWAEVASSALASSASFKDEMVAVLLSADGSQQHEDSDLEEDSASRLLTRLGLSKEDDALDNDAKVQQLTMWRMKRLLTRMGFGYQAFVREAVKTIESRIGWTISACSWYFAWLHTPQCKDWLLWMDESFIYVGEGRPGGILPPGASATSTDKGDFR